MSRFRYRAVDRAGHVLNGELDAADRRGAVDVIERLGQIPLSIDDASRGWLAWLHRPILGTGSIGQRELAELTRELAALLTAELTVDRSLALLRDIVERESVRQVIEGLLERVRQGASLSDALADSSLFPSYYVSLVRAGELSGTLAAAMQRLAELLEREREVRERVQSALIYPAILVGMVLVTFALTITVVLPRFEALFAEQGALLPWPTRLVLWLGHLARDDGWLLVLSLGATSALAIRAWQKPDNRARVQSWLLRRPAVGAVVRARQNAAVFRTVATMLANGITLPAALRLGAASASYLPVRAAVEEVGEGLKEGRSLAGLLDQHAAVVPRLVIQLARVGEETGRLDQMLAEAADILDRDAQRSTERLLALLVPALTIGMGLVIAGLIGSVLVGILSVNELV